MSHFFFLRMKTRFPIDPNIQEIYIVQSDPMNHDSVHLEPPSIHHDTFRCISLPFINSARIFAHVRRGNEV